MKINRSVDRDTKIALLTGNGSKDLRIISSIAKKLMAKI